MSDTLEKLRSMLVKHLGARSSAIDLDSPFQSVGLDDADLEELKVQIEENFELSLSVLEEDHREISLDSPVHNLKELTLRQLACWIDGWINRDEIHPPFHGRHTKST